MTHRPRMSAGPGLRRAALVSAGLVLVAGSLAPASSATATSGGARTAAARPGSGAMRSGVAQRAGVGDGSGAAAGTSSGAAASAAAGAQQRSGQQTSGGSARPVEDRGYPNPEPVNGGVATHDPSMIRAKDGSWYVFSTGPGIQIRHSPDRRHWTYVGEVLPTGAAWASAYQGSGATDLWAPDVSYHHGTYYLYYSVSTFGHNLSAIGLATSTSLRPGSWHDQGLVYASASTDTFNAIDPGLVVTPAGQWWLSLGSFWGGIKAIQLDPATGKPTSAATTLYSLAQRAFPDAIEGSYLYRHGGYYYLFASFDFCCQGLSSTYSIHVGRSRTVTGPYLDEAGTPLMQGGGTTLLATHGYVVGPGGQTVLRVGRRDLLVYHFYNGLDGGTPHLGLNTLRWVGGWPVVTR